ncbi:MAG: DUF2600 family protein [Mycobacterium leprae]
MPIASGFLQQFSTAYAMHRHCRLEARQCLREWEAAARAIPDPALRQQALSSILTKGFHCEGGSVYAAGAHERQTHLVSAIVAFQTLVDYLDNLSDRMGSASEPVLRQIHTAVPDALTPGAPIRTYAAGAQGYLSALVQETQRQLAALPGYGLVAAQCLLLGDRYCELQVLKHLPDPALRAPSLAKWLSTLAPECPGWQWWEMAAACGSTLGLFTLWMVASHPGAPGNGELLAAYFPWICGLHILLDYYIDQAEDLAGGDLNLVQPYGDTAAATAGIGRILLEARRRARALPEPTLHTLVVDGLPGLYLSDPKVRHQGLSAAARQILRHGGLRTRMAYWYCRAVPPIR